MAEQTTEEASRPPAEIKPVIVLQVEPGELVFDAGRRAAKMSILENKVVSFTHNENTQTITPDEAKQILTPEKIKQTMDKMREDQDRERQDAERRIAQLDASIKDEMDFARKAYPTEFPPDETPKQP